MGASRAQPRYIAEQRFFPAIVFVHLLKFATGWRRSCDSAPVGPIQRRAWLGGWIGADSVQPRAARCAVPLCATKPSHRVSVRQSCF